MDEMTLRLWTSQVDGSRRVASVITSESASDGVVPSVMIVRMVFGLDVSWDLKGTW